MEGSALAAKRNFDLAIVTAWHTAVFGLGMYGGKLKNKNLSDFLSSDEKPNRAALARAQAVAFFHRIKARGVPVDISRLN